MALNFERARPDSIPAELKGRRLLPEGADDAAYYREMISTFLKTVGLEDTDAVADSFKKAGTGGLHRQRTAVAAAASGAFSVAQLAASASMPAKTALSAIQVLMTALTTELGFESANLRFRNSGTEEIMPLGKADASPSAKTGPNVIQAATRVAWDLNKVRHAVRKMESAQTALDDARARLSSPNATAEQREQAKKDPHAAGQNLAIAHAPYCMRAQLKADYKTASESAKIEYHGNKRALGVSVASSAASMTATVLGILTPVVVALHDFNARDIQVPCWTMALLCAPHSSAIFSLSSPKPSQSSRLSGSSPGRVCFATIVPIFRLPQPLSSLNAAWPRSKLDFNARS